ncbi:MAG: TauD/TfdA family dioxygenase [Bradyrhizobiaceae bacterium]|nr:TauD/TfdA family dioxygenase [Bradyrhizobiaceae bacterium]
MDLDVTPLQGDFAARITGVDLTQPIDPQIQRAIERAMDAHAVCVLPGQHIDDAQQVAFSQFYGPLEVSPHIGRKPGEVPANARIKHQAIFDISNLDQNGDVLDTNHPRAAFMRGNELWHTDSSFRSPGAAWSMLHARAVPPAGGNTEFADTRAAYDALPEAMKRRLEGLVAEHSVWHSRAKLGGYVPTEAERKLYPTARHKVVRRHPGSGRNALYIAAHASHIVGMPVAEGEALLQELIDFATQPQFVYSHRWQVGDLVIWDNRCTMHRATPYDAAGQVRELRRTTITDEREEVLAG